MERDDAGLAKPRERIIKTARDLFRRHGIRGVGVDAIAEKAGTNKMTLYRHFGSKDELIIECLREFQKEVEAIWRDVAATHPGDPMAQIRAWMNVVAKYALGDMRGCDMANAAVELAEDQHPARLIIEEFKKEQRERLAQLCRDAGIAQPEQLADTLSLLIEGARVNVQVVGRDGPGARFIALAESVLAAFAGDAAVMRPAKPATAPTDVAAH